MSGPGATEAFKRGLYAVLQPFFDGSTHTINCEDREFPEADVEMNVIRLDVPLTKPVIAITGHVPRSQVTHKACVPVVGCEDRPGYECRTILVSIVTVAIPIDVSDATKSKREADRVYDLAALVLNTQRTLLAAQNIHNSYISPVGQEIAHKEYALITSRLVTELRTLHVNN